MIDVVLFGIGGYGAGYVSGIARIGKEIGMRLTAAVDLYASDEAKKALSPAMVFATAEDFYASGIHADLCVISTPIALHEEMAISAMRHGYDVLLEKPVAADSDSAERILAAQRETGKRCSVGFQLCFDESMRRFKQDILDGVFGRCLSMASITLWPRGYSYYNRSTGWAGKRYDAQGRKTFDSVASNATAHYLMNLLWVAGDTLEGAAETQNIQASVSRANNIETFDTIAFTATANGIPITYLASHAVKAEETKEPTLRYHFENAVVDYVKDGKEGITATFKDGTKKVYPLPEMSEPEFKLALMSQCLRNNTPVPCPIETALAHARVMDCINELPVATLPAVENADKSGVYCEGLAEKLQREFEKNA